MNSSNAPVPLLRAGINVVENLERADLGDGQSRGRGRQGERAAGGDPVQARRPARVLDQRGNVLELALDRVRRGVAALASTAAVVAVNGEVVDSSAASGAFSLRSTAPPPPTRMTAGPVPARSFWSALIVVIGGSPYIVKIAMTKPEPAAAVLGTNSACRPARPSASVYSGYSVDPRCGESTTTTTPPTEPLDVLALAGRPSQQRARAAPTWSRLRAAGILARTAPPTAFAVTTSFPAARAPSPE